MARIEMYAATWCPFCIRAKSLLDSKGVSYTYIDVDAKPDARTEMQDRGGGMTIPQIFIDDQHIGGCDDLYELEHRGRLDPILGLA